MQLFKSKPACEHTAPARGPLRTALDTHLAKMSTIDKERRTLNERAGALVDTITAADACAREIAALQAKIDARQVASVVAGDTAPVDLTAERATLAHLEQRHTILAERADVARKARDELHAKSEVLLRDEYRPRQRSINSLLLDALREDMQSFAPELRSAERAYRAVLRKVFLRAAAIDILSTQNKMGVFVDSLRYCLHVPQLPKGEPFDSLCPNNFEINTDYAVLQIEAEQLIDRILKGDASEQT